MKCARLTCDKWLAGLILMAGILTILLALSGCGTAHGIGQLIEGLGQDIGGAVQGVTQAHHDKHSGTTEYASYD